MIRCTLQLKPKQCRSINRITIESVVFDFRVKCPFKPFLKNVLKIKLFSLKTKETVAERNRKVKAKC